MNNSISISVTCDNYGTRERFMSLAEKMEKDYFFKSKLNLCQNEEDVYRLYKEHGYTDLSFTDFVRQFTADADQLLAAQKGNSFELSEDELENVVGGFNWFRFFTSVVSIIPVVGPVITGAAKAIKAAVEGQGFEKIADSLISGLTGAVVDVAVFSLTGGCGTAVKIAAGVAGYAVKLGLNEVLS